MTTNINKVSIDLGDRAYDISIGAGLDAGAAKDVLPYNIGERESFIIADSAVANFAKQFRTNLIKNNAPTIKTLWLEGGEPTKAWQSYQDTCEWLLEHGVKRDSVIYAIGGGVIGDLVGFAAATVMRGVDFVQVPTTLLAQVDSSVGGKTGINSAQGKNLVGAFYQPQAVVMDLDALKTLPKRQLLAGYAEVVKYALINDISFFDWLENNGEAVCNLKPEALSKAIEVSVKAKAAIVQEDEKEQGARALLNLGHTFGHALEAAAGYDGSLLHGEAVAIGMVMAFQTSVEMGLCDRADLERIINHFTAVGLPTVAADIDQQLNTTAAELMELMKKDKKADKSSIKFILAKGIGQSFVTRDVDMSVVKRVIKDSLSG